jgi:Tfp pilus assembly protein PilX
VRRTRQNQRSQTGFKLILVLAPFLLVLVLGLVEWWLRSRGL